jgi:ribosome maturation factor RimP
LSGEKLRDEKPKFNQLTSINHNILSINREMTHPLVPEIINLAKPLAQKLGLEVVDIIFQTNKKPPVLRVDIRNTETDTSLDNCEQMSRLLEETLDTKEIIPSTYVLEISSPGISRQLSTDRDFISFKGFPVVVETHTPYKKETQWRGNLQGRDEKAIYILKKGKIINIPLEFVEKVQFDAQS